MTRQPYTVSCPDADHDDIPASSRENARIIADGHSVKHGHTPTIGYEEDSEGGADG